MRKISLAGGSEFGGKMATLDREALEAAGGMNARVSIIPAAAAPDNNHARAGANGVNWFRKLGIAEARALPLIDRQSAADPQVIAALRRSNLIYLLGGFPVHLATALAGSPAWRAIKDALDDGAVISGSSAGAMVLCEHFFDPQRDRPAPGLNLIHGVCVLPHHNTFGNSWAPRLQRLIPKVTLVGIDEQTGVINDGPGGSWRVCGPGSVFTYRDERVEQFRSDDMVLLDPST